MTTVSNAGELLAELEADRAVAGHHRRIRDRVDEQALDAACRGRASSATRPRAARGSRAAETLDRVELRARRRLGRDDRRGHARLARGPRDALRHVAGARRDDAACELGWRRRADAGARRAA